MNRRGFGLVEGVISLAIVAIMITLVVTSGVVGIGRDYANGERAGVITKLSKKGVFYKSYEGELLVALPVDVAGTTQPERFDFNVDPSAVTDVEEAMSSGRRVTLVYRQWWQKPASIENDHVVTGVRYDLPRKR